VPAGDLVEGLEENVGVLVFDQATGEEDVVALVGKRGVPDPFDVDTVRDDVDGPAVGTDSGEAVGRDRGDRYRVLWRARGETLHGLPERCERAEILPPVVAPDLVPRRD
jgi:hypothetical protein